MRSIHAVQLEDQPREAAKEVRASGDRDAGSKPSFVASPAELARGTLCLVARDDLLLTCQRP